MCAFMASGGIGFFSSVSVYNGFGLRNKLRDGPLHNEKARGIFFSPHAMVVASLLTHRFSMTSWQILRLGFSVGTC